MQTDRIVRLGSCPICDNHRFERVSTPTTWVGKECFEDVAESLALQRCNDCRFVFVNPRPSEDLVQAFYRAGTQYDCHDLATHRDPAVRTDFVLDLVEEYRPHGYAGRLLDFGCGAGSFVARAIERGWDAIGFDIGQRARSACVERGVPFVGSWHALRDQRFDVITLNHVFEHVFDYRSFFRVFDEIVSDETFVYVEVPNAASLRARMSLPAFRRFLPLDERYRAFPLHLSYFDAQTLPALFERFGYELVRRHNFGLGVDELFANGAGAKAAFRERSDTRRDRSQISQLAREALKKSLFALNLGENIAVVVRRAPSVTWHELANGCLVGSSAD